jgi:hypothetical protein
MVIEVCINCGLYKEIDSDRSNYPLIGVCPHRIGSISGSHGTSSMGCRYYREAAKPHYKFDRPMFRCSNCDHVDSRDNGGCKLYNKVRPGITMNRMAKRACPFHSDYPREDHVWKQYIL